MATPFDDIVDRFLIVVRDYRLDQLFKVDENAFQSYVDGFLIKSIPKFSECLTSLDYDATTRQFTETLSNKEIDILSDLTLITWFDSCINDVTQFNLHLSTRDFKIHSESSNLKEKSERVDRIREKIKQDITDYELTNLDKIDFFKG